MKAFSVEIMVLIHVLLDNEKIKRVVTMSFFSLNLLLVKTSNSKFFQILLQVPGAYLRFFLN